MYLYFLILSYGGLRSCSNTLSVETEDTYETSSLLIYSLDYTSTSSIALDATIKIFAKLI